MARQLEMARGCPDCGGRHIGLYFFADAFADARLRNLIEADR